MTKEKISDDEVIQCKKVIYNLISVETKHEPLLLPNLGQRAKGQKREEQYKVMWNELEMLLKSNLHTENHRSVYNCLLECHKFNIDDDKLDSEHGIIDLDHGKCFNDYDNLCENVIGLNIKYQNFATEDKVADNYTCNFNINMI